MIVSRTNSRLAAALLAVATILTLACGSAQDAADETPANAATPGVTRPPSSPPSRSSSTASSTTAPSPASTETPAIAPPTAAPCIGRCPGDLATPTPPSVDDDGVPRVPLLRALTFSPGDDLTLADLALRGAGTPGRGAFLGAALVIPSIGVDAPIEPQVVGANGVMPEPSSFQTIAWYDFALWPGLGGVPLDGGNVVMAANFGGVFAQLHAVGRGKILVLHLGDGRRLFYHVEFNKTVVSDGADWAAINAATSNESMTLITAAGSGSGANWTHRRIVWARRVNCELREAPETPTRAPYVECELPR